MFAEMDKDYERFPTGDTMLARTGNTPVNPSSGGTAPFDSRYARQ